MPSHVAFNKPGHFADPRSQDLIKLLDEDDLKPKMNQVLRHLETDEAASNDHRAPSGLQHLDAGVVVHPRKVCGAFFNPFADRPHIGHGSNLKDAWQIDTGQGRMNRGRTGRQYELVVGSV